MYSDEDIALLIANQAKKQSVLAQRIGPSAFLSSAKPFKVGEKASINKSFLANTIRSVETHNRREEIEDCWRQHRLDKRKREDCEDYEHENPSKAENNFEDERAKWSKKKLKAFAAKMLIDDETESGEIKSSDESSSSDSSDSSEDKRSKKNKKHRKEKREKKEKKSKKEKKHKKEKSEKKEKKKKRDRSPGEDS